MIERQSFGQEGNKVLSRNVLGLLSLCIFFVFFSHIVLSF